MQTNDIQPNYTTSRTPDKETIVEIIDAFQTHLDADVKDLPPLQHTVDSDGLRHLLDNSTSDTLTVTFDYHNHTVKVTNDTIAIYN